MKNSAKLKEKILRIIQVSKKTRFITFIFLLFILINNVSSRNKSFLWKIKTHNSTMYLLGSIHVAKRNIFPLPRIITRSFNECDNIVLEIDLNKVDQIKMMQFMVKHGYYKSNDTIKNHISRKTFIKLKKRLKSFGLNVNAFIKYKPWLLSMTILMLSLRKINYKAENGIDYYFFNKAKGKKTIHQLETAIDQLKIFTNFSSKLSEQFLLSSLAEDRTNKKIMEYLVKAWKTGDVNLMEKFILQTYNTNPIFKPLFDRLIKQRNINMTNKILKFLKTGKKYFVVVGAAHLVGDFGIIKLLEKKGYKAVQL